MKYDNLNRPIETGLLNSTVSFTDHLSAAGTNPNYLPSGTYELLTITHYDNYTGLPAGLSVYLNDWNSYFSGTDNSNWPYPQMPAKSDATVGMVTWTQTKVLGTVNQFINTVNYYDDKGRMIQVQSTNISGSQDVLTTQYSWNGLPLVTVLKTEKGTPNPQTSEIVTKISYDDLWRVSMVEKKASNSLINGGVMPTTFKTILKNEYDKLGQLKKKKLGTDPSNPTSALETLNYEYNIRGWMLGMNRDYLAGTGQSGTSRFGFELGYDKVTNASGRNFLGAGMFNGNIAGMVWKSDGDDVKRKYDFTYDAANRLLSGLFEQDDAIANWNANTMNYSIQMGNGVSPSTAYDANGNIQAMTQQGWKLGSPTAVLDNLTYSYFLKTNRLQAVTDAVNSDNKLGDFTDKNSSPTRTMAMIKTVTW
ncbi:MAG: hypothetical protein IPP99_04025 [Chitinophagaceae bacterium]|nr:hypothetical protein [Chitinophagaceae bacterium]